MNSKKLSTDKKHSQQSKGRAKPAKAVKTQGEASRKAAAELFLNVVDEGQSLDVLFHPEKGFAPYLGLETRDQNLTRAILGNALRHRGEIDFILNKMMDRPAPKRARHLYAVLTITTAQIFYMDVPERASVNIAIGLIGADGRSKRFKSFANAILRRMCREKEDLLKAIEAPERWLDNLPKWLLKKLRQDYGLAKLKQICAIHRHAPSYDISLKQSEWQQFEKWEDALNAAHLPNHSLRMREGQMVENLHGFHEGKWWVQDASAAMPARLLGDVRDKYIADLCAAPGGKTAQLLDQGAVVCAIELKQNRIKRLEENLKRLNLQAEIVQADILEYEPPQHFDGLLLDAPCSSTGTLRRHPDVAYNKSPEDIASLAALQLSLWKRAAGWLKSGGVLVFSNCSLLKDEGESLYRQMLEGASELGIEPLPIEAEEVPGFEEAINRHGCLRILPLHMPNEAMQLAGADGFFAARFKKL